MATYKEVMNQVQSPPPNDQISLLEELKKIVYHPVEVEGDDEVISAKEIAENKATLQDYLTWRDSGISSKELKSKLFGDKID